MATIGTFTKTSDGGLVGAINTLNLRIKSVQFRPIDKVNDKAPDFRVVSAGVELGAAWKKTTSDQRDYLSVRLDDPSLSKGISAAMFEVEDGYTLVWSRPPKRRRRADS
jgi:uncharacterized protein (DUF736 family)